MATGTGIITVNSVPENVPLRILKPNDKIEAPIIACNDNFPTNRTRRPSTPNKVYKTGCSGAPNIGRKGRDDKKPGARIRSVSAGRGDKKGEMCSRYWAYLFENLERSITEIYEGCEKEENIRQCKEVVFILENYTRDFTKLIEWLNLQCSYEKTPPPMRPNALAWEIRKPSICLLPHTRAFEKLFGRESEALEDSSSKEQLKSIGLQNKSKDLPSSMSNNNNPETVVKSCEVKPSSCHGSPKQIASEPQQPILTTVTPTTTDNTDNGFLSVAHTTTTTPFEIFEIPEPVQFSDSNTVEIGLQTDLEEDPDIFYFAGGRTVACQTDYSEEYGPLSLMSFSSSPVIRVTVLNTSDSDMENSLAVSLAAENNNSNCETSTTTKTMVVDVSNNNNNETPVTSNVESPPQLPSSSCVVEPSNNNSLATTVIENQNQSNNNNVISSNRPSTPVETKSSATQLSAGVLIDETPGAEDNKNNVEDNSVKKQQEKSTANNNELLVKPSKISPSVPVTPAKTTFAEKAKSGLRHSQSQAKSVASYLNKVGVSSSSKPLGAGASTTLPRGKILNTTSNVNKRAVVSAGGSASTARGQLILNALNGVKSSGNAPGVQSQSKVKVAPIPNYRSNIASRCRTAVNTGQAPGQTETQTKSAKTPVKLTPSSATNNSNSTTAASNAENSYANISKTSSNANASIINGAKEVKEISVTSGILSKRSSTGNSESLKKVPSTLCIPTSLPSSDLKQTELRQGITRSKSMVNPLVGTTKGFNKTNMAVKNNKNSSAMGLKGPPASGSFKRLHSNSYISLPDETVYRRRSSTVDEDGWETVKTRSSRSKWSSSNSSLASSNPNQSRNSLDKGSTTGSAQKNASPSTKQPAVVFEDTPSSTGDNSNKADVLTDSQTSTNSGDAETSVDDEEIKKKEADLDNAIREEELLEQELLKVEKEFESIENNDSTTEDGTITDSEHAASPEVLDCEMDMENDHFFFVSMDDQEAEKMEELPPREPGRLLSFREKLMSPAKKCDGAETLKRYEAKLAQAEKNRERKLRDKFKRYVELSDRFEALNETTKKLVSERAELIAKAEERRKRAAEKRQQNLKNIKRKAHDEDSKAKEIAFINLLEAQNKRHDYFVSAQEIEDRLQTMHEERRLKLEERAGKALLVIKRQSHIKKDWQGTLKELQEKRRKNDERIAREKNERAKERTEMAQEKARDREERISALNAAKQAEKEELQKKIKQKQEDTARRHEENMEHIRQKAIELSAPRTQEENSAPSSVRVCTLCKVILQSEIHEMQHIRGRTHLDCVKKLEKMSADCNGGLEGFGLKFIADVQADKIDSKVHPDKNRNKAVKKHSKKLIQKLMESGLEFEKLENERQSDKQWGDPNLKSKTRKNILELDRLVCAFSNNNGSQTMATQMDRLMADIRKASVKNEFIKEAVIGMNGLTVALKVLQCTAVDLPMKTKVAACEMIQGFVVGSLSNGLYILRGTAVCTIMNLCAEQWNSLIPDDNRWLCNSPMGSNESLPTDPLIEAVVALLYNLLEYVPNPFNGIMRKGSTLSQQEIQAIKTRTQDIIGYLVASGVIDRISVYCGGVRGPVDDQPAVAYLLQVFMDFLVVLVYTLQFCWGENPTGCIMNKKEPDGTQLLAALETSELAGAVSMSYSLLLHQGAPTRPRTGTAGEDLNDNPPPPGEKTAAVVKSTLCLINAMARLDLLALQNVLGSETVSLQFRHIASQLLWQVVPNRSLYSMRRLLTELIIAIGNFTVGSKHNQATIQSGQTPTVLQLLCSLPKEYFTDSKLSHNFLPTLLAATHGCTENRKILLQKQIDIEALDNYLNSEEGKSNVIIRRMICVSNPSNGVANVGKGNGKKSKKGVKPLEENNLSKS